MAIVDHDERRDRIADQACALIAEGGIEAVTFRRLASIDGLSTSVITYYFPNRTQILLHVFTRAAHRADERVNKADQDTDGDPLAWILSQMPVDEQSRIDWRVFLAFYQVAAVDREMATVETWWIDYACANLAKILLRTGRVKAETAPRIARQLISLVIGIAMQWAVDPAKWTVARQRSDIADQLRLLRIID